LFIRESNPIPSGTTPGPFPCSISNDCFAPDKGARSVRIFANYGTSLPRLDNDGTDSDQSLSPDFQEYAMSFFPPKQRLYTVETLQANY
jgi:hypothetical protein